MAEAGLAIFEFWESTPRELAAIATALVAKEKRAMHTQSHFTAALINYVLGSLSRSFEPITGAMLLGEEAPTEEIAISDLATLLGSDGS